VRVSNDATDAEVQAAEDDIFPVVLEEGEYFAAWL